MIIVILTSIIALMVTGLYIQALVQAIKDKDTKWIIIFSIVGVTIIPFMYYSLIQMYKIGIT